jgi:hypothetical protein
LGLNRIFLAVGLVFGTGMALALNNWLLGIMFGIIFFAATRERIN